MADVTIAPGSLVVYKNRPSCVKTAGEKLEIALESGKTLNVRPKDVLLLHPGPIHGFDDLQAPEGEVETAWELLAGETTTLPELAELAYGAYTPATAWAIWQLLTEGLYFRGTMEAVLVSSAEDVEREQAARAVKAAEEQSWASFVERLHAGRLAPEDRRYMQEVEEVALGRRTMSRVLRELHRPETPDKAHALLLRLGYWEATVNPYPQRFGFPTTPPMADLPALPAEERRDLTHLPAFAIDDEGNQDPDDALSLDGDRLWVHVADVAALIPPDSPADIEARGRGANLYLPEQTIAMLPAETTHRLGLGLHDISPALSFGVDTDTQGDIVGVEIVPSWVRVTRLTYAEANDRLAAEPFRRMVELTDTYQARRRANDAVFIELPEVKIRVEAGQVMLIPLLPLESRTLVTEAMLMAGEAAARFALERHIPLPFTTQDPPEVRDQPEDLPPGLPTMFALRRTLKRSQQTSVPGPHAGLGLGVYTRATSPLRRYLDLVVHQQLRAYLRGSGVLGEQEVLERVGAAEAVTGSVRQAERLANRHWTLVYFLQHPHWRGEGIVVEKRLRRTTIMIPACGFEVQLPLSADVPLGTTVQLTLQGVSLPDLEAHFQVSE